MLLGTATACTDTWDDHYAEKVYGDGSLMEAISKDPNLSNFQAVLQATGYDAALGGSQVFTVFAPTNDNFTEADRDAVIAQYNQYKAQGVKDAKNLAIKEFIQNHIALYNYSLSKASQDTAITMMNGKRVGLTASAFEGQSFVKSNVQTGNGVLFTIAGQAKYNPNIFEYLEKDADLDSVKNFIYKYNEDKFMAALSVPGEIIDGKIQYLDSVTVTKNDLLARFDNGMNAVINDEDSTYIFLAPTNKEWDKQLQRNMQMFVYDKQVAEKDSFEYLFPRMQIIRGSFFSAGENRGLMEQSAALDSVVATTAYNYAFRQMLYGSYDKRINTYMKPFASNGIFAGTQDVTLSNGMVKKSKNWPIKRNQTFLYDIVMEAENSNTLDSLNLKSTKNPRGNTATPVYRSVASTNKFYNKVSGNGYLELSPSGTANITNALFDIRNVLSNVTYDVYVVMAPAEAGDTLASQSERVPAVFRASLQCNGLNGKAYYMPNNGTFSTLYPVEDYPSNNASKWATIRNKCFVNNLSQADGVSVDSVYVGRFTFPTCSYNISDAQVKMLVEVTTTSTQANKGTHTKTFRMDCIVFKPVEQE